MKIDKLLHFLAGYFIANSMGILFGWEIGLFIGSLSGILKEYWDSKGHGNVEFLDFVYTFLGSIFGTIILTII